MINFIIFNLNILRFKFQKLIKIIYNYSKIKNIQYYFVFLIKNLIKINYFLYFFI